MHGYESRQARTIGTLMGLASMLVAGPALAQSTDAPGALGGQPFSHMHMLYERTIFKVDVLTLDICFDSVSSDRLAAFARSDLRGAEDSIAAVALRARSAIGTIRFLRDASQSQFLDGIRDEQEKAVRAGFLSDSTFRSIGQSLPVWFEFLEERGIRDGDRIAYVFHGDSLRSFYRGVEGTVWLDHIDVGDSRRRSVLATWFAPGTSFRKPLIRSLAAGGIPPAELCALPASAPDTSNPAFDGALRRDRGPGSP